MAKSVNTHYLIFFGSAFGNFEPGIYYLSFGYDYSSKLIAIKTPSTGSVEYDGSELKLNGNSYGMIAKILML